MNQKTQKLVSDIINMINNTTPIHGQNGNTLTIEDLKFSEPEAVNDISKQLEMKYMKDKNLEGYISGKIVIRDKDGKIISKSGQIKTLIPVPIVTERGTYLINGTEKQIVNQMRLKPGIYTNKLEGVDDVKTNIMVDNSAGSYIPQITLIYSPLKNEFKFTVKSRPEVNFNGINFLRIIGFSDMEIKKLIGNDYISDQLFEKYGNRNQKTINDLYKALTYKTSKETPDKIKNELSSYLKDNAQFGSGTSVVRDNLGVKENYLSKNVIGNAVKNTFAVFRGDRDQDDKDDLRFKDVIDDNDFIIENIKKDWDNFLRSAEDVLNRKKKDVMYTDIRPLSRVGVTLKKSLATNPIVQSPEETNPLFMASMNKKVTQLGQGGMSIRSAENETSARDLATNSVNRLDPVETPESGKIGLVEHMTQDAYIEDKTIKTTVYKVKNGKAKMTASNQVALSPNDEYKSKVAFFDTRYVKSQGGEIVFIKTKVPARYMGKITDIPIAEIQYIDKSPQSLMGYATNMIPFVAHNDGNRALMGSNMQKQAIILKNREAPLVSTLIDPNKKITYDEYLGENYGKPIKANADGIVSKIEGGKIFIKDKGGNEHVENFYEYYPLNQSYINNDLKIKVGDKVKKNQIIAEGWQTKDGKLALGMNARVAYLPFKGYNYEDGIVVSRSFAKKMASEEMEEQVIEIPKKWKGGRGSNVSDELIAYTRNPEVNQKLDKDGIIKVGQYVKPGDILVATLKPVIKKDSYDNYEEAILAEEKELKYTYNPIKIESSSYVEGEVKRVTIINNPDASNKQKVVITLINSKPLKLGDKISGRHGNKGTITKILDDDEMPVAEDGKSVDVLFSPLAVPSRKNVGQLFEVNAGLIAEKTGKPYLVSNFDYTEKDKVLKQLDKIGYPDGKMKMTLKEKQPDGTIKEIPVENPVTVGDMYIMKLKHKIDDKIQQRSNLETAPNKKTYMPAKVVGVESGVKSNPQRLGEMEMRALQGHQAVWNILESSTIKSDGGGDISQRLAMFNAIADGKLDGLDMPATPESLHVMSDTLKALGLNVKPINNGNEVETLDDAFDSLAITPIKETDFIKMVGKNAEVTQPKLYMAKDIEGIATKTKAKTKGKKKKIEIKEDVPVKGGLMDPKIFGDLDTAEARKKWGYIKLATPMPNPMLMENSSYNPYTLLTGLKTGDLQDLAKGKKLIIADPDKYNPFKKVDPSLKDQCKKDMAELGLKPGDLVNPSEIDKLSEAGKYIVWKTGGDAITDMLKGVNVDKELKNAQKELDAATGKDINKAYKKYKLLTSLKNNNMKPSDLMMSYVPVAPTYFRPVMQTKDKKSYIIDDLNKLYGDLLKANTPVKDTISGFDMYQMMSPVDAAKASGNIYRKITDITGHTTKKDVKTKKELRNIKDSFGGKDGLVRGQMLSKAVDFSGRSVIGVDPGLKINEVGVPMDMARQVYKPFIIKELIDQGFAANASEANKKWKAMDVDTKHVTKQIAKDRPLLLNRAPSLHKFSIMAFDPIIKETEDGEVVRSIHLNPLVVEGFNADFDGDQMSVHVPITERAKDEAKKLMMPSENLINPTDGKMIINIRHEMALGIYYLTINSSKPQGPGKTYLSYNSLRKDYRDGKINARDKVTIQDARNVTAGSALFNLLIPKKYRDYTKIWSKNEISKMLTQMYDDAEASGWKNTSQTEICALIDKIKELGFEAATRSGVSIGTSDFKKVDGIENIFNKNINDAKKKFGDSEEAVTMGWMNAEKEIQNKLKNGEILDVDNPLQIMMASGARAKPDQIRRMMVSVGVGMDVNKNLVKPIKNSHYDGLAPWEYWMHGKDSRKGIADRSVSTREPGKITREVWSATQDVVVTEKDCKTREGIYLSINNSSLVGRIAAEDVVSENGTIYIKRNQMITKEIRNKMYKDETIKKVKVRSTLKCKTSGGVCQMCYGAMPGTTQLPKEGTPVGILASQAMGEPVTQMTMNTFHGGGTSSSATLGLPRVESILNLSKDSANGAVLAKVSGKVTEIKKEQMKDIVIIGGKAHDIPHIKGKSQGLKVKIGDEVNKGDFLTYGDLSDLSSPNTSNIIFTNADPKKLYELKMDALGPDNALEYVQDYLTSSMEYTINETIGSGSMDRKHIETIIGKMTSKATILDPGDSKYIKGQEVDRNELIKWNQSHDTPSKVVTVLTNDPKKIIDRKAAKTYRDSDGKVIVAGGEIINNVAYTSLISSGYKDIRVYPKPIVFENQLHSKGTIPTAGHDNWFSNLGHQDVYTQLARGATLGQVDKLEDPRARLMSGKLLNIGEGFKTPKNVKNNISTKMYNFFSGLKK